MEGNVRPKLEGPREHSEDTSVEGYSDFGGVGAKATTAKRGIVH